MIFFVLDGLNRKRVADEEARNSRRVAGGSFVGRSGPLRQLAPEREDYDQGQQQHANRHPRNCFPFGVCAALWANFSGNPSGRDRRGRSDDTSGLSHFFPAVRLMGKRLQTSLRKWGFRVRTGLQPQPQRASASPRVRRPPYGWRLSTDGRKDHLGCRSGLHRIDL